MRPPICHVLSALRAGHWALFPPPAAVPDIQAPSKTFEVTLRGHSVAVVHIETESLPPEHAVPAPLTFSAPTAPPRHPRSSEACLQQSPTQRLPPAAACHPPPTARPTPPAAAHCSPPDIARRPPPPTTGQTMLSSAARCCSAHLERCRRCGRRPRRHPSTAAGAPMSRCPGSPCRNLGGCLGAGWSNHSQ